MAIKLNWDTLNAVREDLVKQWQLQSESKLVFVLLLKDGSHHKKTIKFKDFFRFFWFIYDNNKFFVQGLLIMNLAGNILYRHQHINNSNEHIPVGGNIHVFERWNSLTQSQKDTHIKLLTSQIYDYTSSSRNTND